MAEDSKTRLKKKRPRPPRCRHEKLERMGFIDTRTERLYCKNCGVIVLIDKDNVAYVTHRYKFKKGKG